MQLLKQNKELLCFYNSKSWLLVLPFTKCHEGKANGKRPGKSGEGGRRFSSAHLKLCCFCGCFKIFLLIAFFKAKYHHFPDRPIIFLYNVLQAHELWTNRVSPNSSDKLHIRNFVFFPSSHLGVPSGGTLLPAQSPLAGNTRGQQLCSSRKGGFGKCTW